MWCAAVSVCVGVYVRTYDWARVACGSRKGRVLFGPKDGSPDVLFLLLLHILYASADFYVRW